MEKKVNNRRIVASLVLIVLLALTIIPASRSLLFEGHLFAAVDQPATEYVDDALVRAGSAFAIARSFNAIISVFQESELQLEPGGVGVSLALGAALDPANDLIERFSWVMLLSLTSLGVQKVLIEITPFVSVQIILTLALVTMLAGLWIPESKKINLMQMAKLLLFAAILLRFAVPAMSCLNNQVYLSFLEERHNQSVEALSQTVTTLEMHQLNGPEESEDSGNGDNDTSWWDRTTTSLDQLLGPARDMLDVKGKLEKIKQVVLKLIDKVVDLIVVFVLSTIVLPLLFLWGIVKAGKLIVGQGFFVHNFGWFDAKLPRSLNNDSEQQ